MKTIQQVLKSDNHGSESSALETDVCVCQTAGGACHK